MSFKIFSLQFMGKIKPVEKIEQQRASLENDYREFLRVEESEELAEFLKLEEQVNSAEFKKEKAEIEALQFKGSTESKQLNDFEKLKKAKHLKKYFAVADSQDLKRYQNLQDSEKLGEYNELSKYVKEGQFQKDKKEIKGQVFKGSAEEKNLQDLSRLEKSADVKAYLKLKDPKESEQFRANTKSQDLKKYLDLKTQTESKEFKDRIAYLKDNKKFEKSDAFKKLQRFKSLASDPDVKFYQKFGKSSLYKNYINVKDSSDLKRFNELKEITTSKEFLERKAYLEDKKKWEKTEAYAMQQKYLEMKKLPHLEKYFKYKNSADFDFFKYWEVVFEDDFSSSSLHPEKWSVNHFMADKMIGSNYSMPGDLQTYTDGKNLKTGGKLTIEVRKEKHSGTMWKMPAGFIPAEFDYTSGLVSTGTNFWMEDGIMEAKIKFQPVKQLASSFYLMGEKNTPRVNLLEMGVKNRLGFASLNGNGKYEWEGIDISNLKKGQSYIFTLEKSGTTFTWKINDAEVLKMNKQELNTPLHLNASSLVVYDVPGAVLPAQFDIEWVKCYRKN